jgi:hypothetical protein
VVLLQPHAGADVRGGSSDPTPATTTANSTDTTNPAKPTVRSESVAATLFGLGALRFLCGIFFTRLAQLTLPGGAGMELLPPATQAKVLKKAAAIAKERDADSPDTISTIYFTLLNGLRDVLSTEAAFRQAADDDLAHHLRCRTALRRSTWQEYADLMGTRVPRSSRSYRCGSRWWWPRR